MRVVVVGNGVAGITCALEIRRREPKWEITVVSGETPYFFSRTALMYAYMGRMQRRDLEPMERRVWKENNIRLVQDWMVDLDAVQQVVRLQAGGPLSYDRLVLAVGATATPAPWPGMEQVKDGVVNLVSMQDLDTCERLTPSTRQAVVVGGGLIGVELVECLVHFGIRTTFLIREPFYWPAALGPEEAALVEQHLAAHGVDVRTGDQVNSVAVDNAGRVNAVQTQVGGTVPCQMLGVAIGVRPNIGAFASFTSPPATQRGIKVDAALRTSLPQVWACGDCAEVAFADGSSKVELIWYSAKRQGLLAAHSVLGDSVDYRPPVFFNSSKFMDVEYTTVGDVVRVPAGTPSELLQLPGKPVSVRVVHDGKRVLGFNMLGSRWDHTVLSRWVEEQRSADYALQHLADAQFDVEFGRAPLAAMTRRSVPLQPLGAPP